MNFAFISSLGKPTSPDAHGGQETWGASYLLGEIKNGHTFDLYAIRDSLSKPPQINLCSILDRGESEIKFDPFFQKSDNIDADLSRFAYSTYARIAVLVKEKEESYDMVIDSSGVPLFALEWDAFKKPLIVIGHFPIFKRYVSFFEYFKLPKNVHYVFPSKYQYENSICIPHNQKSYVPHGIDISDLEFQAENKTESLVWVGRIDKTMNKGLDDAINVANKLHLQLNVFGFIEQVDYFNEKIKPSLNPKIVMKTSSVKEEIYRDEKAFIFPIKWEEPFGLVMLESMACGTPVISYARGAVPEIVEDGKTGFIVNPSNEDIRGDFIIKKTGLEGLAEAVEKIYNLPKEEYLQMRKNCRERVEKKFTTEEMIQKYEEVYKMIGS